MSPENANEHPHSSPDVPEYLADLPYPASKSDVIEEAQRQNAPAQILTLLQNLPDRSFSDESDLTSGIGKAG